MMQQTLKHLCLKHIEAINTLSTRELRVSKKIVIIDGSAIGYEEEDLRVSFIQAVQNLATLLNPEFDELMQSYYSKNIIFLEGFAYEIIDKIEDKKFIEKIKSETEDKRKDYLLFYQVQEARKMYLQLNLFLQRTNLLKMEDDYGK
jgi:hypothetical protein